jgi:hypothetical protein
VPFTTTAGVTIAGEHMVFGTGTAGTAVTLTGAAVFSGVGTYECYGSDTASPVVDVEFTYTSASSFTPAAAATDAVRFVCIGS